MAQNKYIVLRSDDAQAFLSSEQKQQLLDILGSVADGRRKAGKSVGDLFFVLNMKDQYAQAAIERYITAIHDDGLANTSPGVQSALDTAVGVRQTAMLTVTTKLPD